MLAVPLADKAVDTQAEVLVAEPKEELAAEKVPSESRSRQAGAAKPVAQEMPIPRRAHPAVDTLAELAAAGTAAAKMLLPAGPVA